MLQPYIKAVRPLSDYRLELHFESDEIKIFDVKPYFEFNYYQRLTDEAYFKTMHVISDKSGIEWGEGHDIAPHELYETSLPATNEMEQ